MRGEHTIQMIDATCQQGSSPHARGAPDCRDACEQRAGIIPACAGSTCTSASPRASCGDHPRMRGEHLSIQAPRTFTKGSSPHARGALHEAPRDEAGGGIIPACAGSTRCTRRSASHHGDHPRMRGEHRCSRASRACRRGSSPHARGARPGTSRSWCPARDHPRMRGEHRHTAAPRFLVLGSSPHARGAPDKQQDWPTRLGIIPACAGSTLEYLRLCPGLKRITLTLPITSEAGKWTEKHPNDQLMPRAFRPSR